MASRSRQGSGWDTAFLYSIQSFTLMRCTQTCTKTCALCQVGGHKPRFAINRACPPTNRMELILFQLLLGEKHGIQSSERFLRRTFHSNGNRERIRCTTCLASSCFCVTNGMRRRAAMDMVVTASGLWVWATAINKAHSTEIDQTTARCMRRALLSVCTLHRPRPWWRGRAGGWSRSRRRRWYRGTRRRIGFVLGWITGHHGNAAHSFRRSRVSCEPNVSFFAPQ